MSMPEANHFFENLPQKGCDVELCGIGGNQYYVATIGGVRGVVTMEGRFQREQQRALDRMVENTKKRKAKA